MPSALILYESLFYFHVIKDKNTLYKKLLTGCFSHLHTSLIISDTIGVSGVMGSTYHGADTLTLQNCNKNTPDADSIVKNGRERESWRGRRILGEVGEGKVGPSDLWGLNVISITSDYTQNCIKKYCLHDCWK